jgi:hypothetical protein
MLRKILWWLFGHSLKVASFIGCDSFGHFHPLDIFRRIKGSSWYLRLLLELLILLFHFLLLVWDWWFHNLGSRPLVVRDVHGVVVRLWRLIKVKGNLTLLFCKVRCYLWRGVIIACGAYVLLVHLITLLIFILDQLLVSVRLVFVPIDRFFFLRARSVAILLAEVLVLTALLLLHVPARVVVCRWEG